MNELDDCWVPTPEDLVNHMVSLARIIPTQPHVEAVLLAHTKEAP